MEVVAVIIVVALVIFIAGIAMIGTNILYDLATAIVPIIAVIMVITGVVVGFFVAIKSTFTVYINVYAKKGKRK